LDKPWIKAAYPVPESVILEKLSVA
jgi:hypothetical protein